MQLIRAIASCILYQAERLIAHHDKGCKHSPITWSTLLLANRDTELAEPVLRRSYIHKPGV